MIMMRFLLGSLLSIAITFSGCILSFFDTTPPVISSVATSVTGYSSAIITWITDEAATSQVEYGTTSNYGSITSLSEARTRSHSVELTDLEPDTTYYYIVMSKDSSGNEATSTGKSLLTEEEDVFSINYAWDFMGKSWTYTTKIDESDYDYFHKKPRSTDYSEYVLNPRDDRWMANLADLFIVEAAKEGWDDSYHIPFVLSFIQSLPYTSDTLTTGYDEYPRYPVETMVDRGGDCEDTSILFASIVREMEYGVALLLLKDDGHMAAGVNISPDLIQPDHYPLTYYPSPDGTKYYYCETTGEGWGVGEKPDELHGTNVNLYVF